MTKKAESDAIDPVAARERQAKLTKSVGKTLTRPSDDAQLSRWRRLLKRPSRS